MASNYVEPMEVDHNDHSFSSLPSVAEDTGHEARKANDEDVATLKVSVTLPEDVEPKRLKFIITTALQTWANNLGVKWEFTATNISDDGTAVIRVKPATALDEFLALGKKEFKTKEEKIFSITPILENNVNKTSKVDENSSVKSFQNLSNEAKSQESSADDNDKTCLVALGPYWYMKNIYKNEMQRIEKENGVKITESVSASIKPDKKRANPKKAYDDFVKLVQSCYDESIGVSIPLKKVGPEEWKETLNLLQMTDRKSQITISSDQITIFGPQQYQTAIIKSLQRSKISTNLTREEGFDEQERRSTEMYTSSYNAECKTPNRKKIQFNSSIKDPFVIDGFPVEKFFWKMVTNQHSQELYKIESKFNVNFKEVKTGQDIKVKTCYNGSGRNSQMESHAVSALLRLYQKVATSQFIKNNLTFDADVDSFLDQSKGTAGEINTADEKSIKESKGGGSGKKTSGTEAKKEEKEEEKCSVCLDTFRNKTQLKSCKHEFCKECLDQSVKSLGSVCPICKDVFGLVEGDQPDGTMTWVKSPISLSGFEGCGSLEITYDIPSGTQTAKHTNPGCSYFGLHRRAYLPDNVEGNEVLQLLKRAFDQRLIFTVGTSRTTGAENVVTWNDIHHKTAIYGGPQSFGYPDPHYLSRVKEELKSKGIK